VCMHPRFKVEWWDRTGGIIPSPVEARQRAQQLALQLEV